MNISKQKSLMIILLSQEKTRHEEPPPFASFPNIVMQYPPGCLRVLACLTALSGKEGFLEVPPKVANFGGQKPQSTSLIRQQSAGHFEVKCKESVPFPYFTLKSVIIQPRFS